MMRWIKQAVKMAAVACIMVLTMASTVFAAGWVQESGDGPGTTRWWYDLGNGQYYSAEAAVPHWEWLDGNSDGIAECYAFDESGWMYAGVTTPDGYDINGEGAWIAGGVVQTMSVAAGYGGTRWQTDAQPAVVTQDMEEADTDIPVSGDGKILIAYFSHTGTTEDAAREIQKVTGGDLFEIRTVNAYPDTYQATVDMARRELDSNARPALAAEVESMADYDTILVGYPIWWHTTPMAVNTFLESYDLSGKTILPFCTSGGSGIEESMPAIRSSAGNGNVGTGLTANSLSAERIQSWLSANGI